MRKLEKLYVEITNVCNLRCSFCPESGRKAEFVSIDRFRTLLAKISGAADGLYFHLKGEPLLHPDLGTLIDLSGEAGFSVMLTTNGTLLSDRADALVGRRALTRLNVSLHSMDDLPDAERGAALERVLTTALALRGNPRFAAPVISLRLWNRTDEAATGALAAGIEGFFSMPSGSLAAALPGARGVLVRSGITVHPAERFDWPRPGGPDRGVRGFCRALRDQAGILVDGTVVPCCLDGEGVIALGNIYGQNWDDIMAGPRARARALYDGFSRRRVVEPLCRTCGYRGRFN